MAPGRDKDRLRQAREFVYAQRAKGKSYADIEGALLAQGWSAEALETLWEDVADVGGWRVKRESVLDSERPQPTAPTSQASGERTDRASSATRPEATTSTSRRTSAPRCDVCLRARWADNVYSSRALQQAFNGGFIPDPDKVDASVVRERLGDRVAEALA